MDGKSYVTGWAFTDFRTGNRVRFRKGEDSKLWYNAIERLALAADNEGKLLYLMSSWFEAARVYSPSVTIDTWGHLTSYAVAVYRHRRQASLIDNDNVWGEA